MFRRTLLRTAPLAGLAVASRANAAPPATVGIMGGQIDGTYMRAATDLTSVVNSSKIRVVPIVGEGALRNVGDLLHLKGVDFAFVNADTLLFARDANLFPGELDKIAYICKLYDDDVHVYARPEIKSLADLNGKPVNIDIEGAGSNLTAQMVFKYSGIRPEFRMAEQKVARVQLLKGDIAAMVYVSGTPINLFADIPSDTGLHFVEVPLNESLAHMYVPGGELTNAQYPKLIPPGEAISTIGVGVTLAAFNWQPNTDRYRAQVEFVNNFFGRFSELLQPPYHPVWRQVNLRAEQPGWPRLKPAADWLAQHNGTAPQLVAQSSERSRFDAFLASHGGAQMTPSERDAAWQYVEARFQRQAASR